VARTADLADTRLIPLRQLPLTSPREIEDFTSQLIQTLTDIADEVAPLRRVKLGRATPWWHHSLINLRNDTRQAFKNYKALRTDDN